MCKVLEMEVDIEAELQGGGALSEVAGAPGSGRLHSEGVILRIREVAGPERKRNQASLPVRTALVRKGDSVVGMCAKRSVELLGVGVGFIPPGLSLPRYVGTECEAAHVPVGHRRERMQRHEGHVVVLVVKAAS